MRRHFFLRRNLARLALRLGRWRTAGDVPARGILVGAPHTSNWDWVLTMLLAWDNSVQIRLLVKDSFFKGPLGVVMRSTGAVELDRSNPGATIRALLADADSDETFLLGIAAEGTRSKGEYWKSGFYRISQQTGIPVTLAYLDRPSRTVGWGPTFPLTGDVGADMQRIRDFYADKQGIRPELTTVPRLREETSGA
ncbi:1-acyl-sn-glycerol-3-phosphate acyltransferase [Nocardioides sp.]|jgi:1-acyl-sn-glycerol-3-phosphate acyltransferase|uniref:1-acyl-sn-glycerol-3-phosphate acyltransferase n=1 Tax=Nocardioides sp. TaxID=35761 RepID=UPI001DFA0BB6|nr:1-acyl-sn-glycerol-3-phosphate acyltransferase [Nocardioides sp.]MBU1802179.1 1-acyl-sn-glycerol-3-phosphate acyltransferase [Actinomycetota bacterium]